MSQEDRDTDRPLPETREHRFIQTSTLVVGHMVIEGGGAITITREPGRGPKVDDGPAVRLSFAPGPAAVVTSAAALRAMASALEVMADTLEP